MSTDYSERYVFEAEWYDKIASLLKKFYLYYFPSDNTIELVRTSYYKFNVITGINLFAV